MRTPRRVLADAVAVMLLLAFFVLVSFLGSIALVVALVMAVATGSAVVLCMAAARGDRQASAALSRWRDSDLADMDGPHSGAADRGVATTGLGPAFSLSRGRSGRPFRRPRR